MSELGVAAFSEHEPGRQLYNTWFGCGRNLAEERTGNAGARIAPFRVVEAVEAFGPDLEFYLFLVQVHVFRHSDVEVRAVWSAERIASERTICTHRRVRGGGAARLQRIER